jgi:hypothetical protein
MRSAALLIAAMLAAPLSTSAAVYTCVDAQGKTVLRDEPCASGERSQTRVQVDEPPAPSVAPAATDGLHRKQVEQFLGRLDRAMGRRNPNAVLALFADDATIEVAYSRGKPLKRLDRAGFGRELESAFAAPRYAYHAAPALISISASPQRATVSRSVRESHREGDATREVLVQERLTIQADGSHLRITQLRRRHP